MRTLCNWINNFATCQLNMNKEDNEEDEDSLEGKEIKTIMVDSSIGDRDTIKELIFSNENVLFAKIFDGKNFYYAKMNFFVCHNRNSSSHLEVYLKKTKTPVVSYSDKHIIASNNVPVVDLKNFLDDTRKNFGMYRSINNGAKEYFDKIKNLCVNKK